MKVFYECKRHGCPPPVYEVSAGDPGDIMVRIDAAPDAVVSGNDEESTKGMLKDGRPIKRPIKDELIDAIKATPGITRPQLMSIVGKGRTVVTEALAALRKDALIEHRGGPQDRWLLRKDKYMMHRPDASRNERNGIICL